MIHHVITIPIIHRLTPNIIHATSIKTVVIKISFIVTSFENSFTIIVSAMNHIMKLTMNHITKLIVSIKVDK